MTEVTVAVLSTVGVIVAGYLGYLGIRFTAASANRVAERSAQTAEWQAIVAAYQALPERVTALEDERDHLATRARDLAGRVEQLERLRDSDARWRRAAVRYMRDLRSKILEHGGRVPVPPVELTVDLDG